MQYSRPGYGDSGSRPGRRVADAAADVAGILDYLGAGKFVTAGWSGGGPHALACAALLPDRCLAAATTPEQLADALGGLVKAADKAAATGDFAEFMTEETKAAFTTGIAGWRDDDLAFVAGWGFELAKIAVPVAIWQGDADAMVPFAHGAWLAASIPGATGHLLPGQGHLTLVADKIGEIIADLASIAPRR